MTNNVRRLTTKVSFDFLSRYLNFKASKKLASNLIANRVDSNTIRLKYYDTVVLTYYQDETIKLSGSNWWGCSHTRRVIKVWSSLIITGSRDASKIITTQLINGTYKACFFYPFEGMHLWADAVKASTTPLINSIPIEFADRASLIEDLEAAFVSNYPNQQGHVVLTPQRGWRSWNARENLSLYKTDNRYSYNCWDRYKIRRTKKFLGVCDRIVERYPIALTQDYARDWILPRIGFVVGARSSALEVACAYLHLSDRGYKL
jgi:hypothetical protein